MTLSFAGPAGSTVSPTRLTDGQLAAIRHLPAAPSRAALVICPPAFHEYQLCQRTLRVLAERLAAAGIASSRVDVRGVGDSVYGPEPVTVAAWAGDALAAAADLRAASGVERVHLLGLRAGAIVAFEAARRLPGALAVLWSLPRSGADHVRALEAVQRDWFAAYAAQHGPDTDPDAAAGSIAGHPAPPELLESLRAWGAAENAAAGVEAIRFETGDSGSDREPEGAVTVPGPAPWRVTIDVAAPPVPAAALERIVATLAERLT